MRYHFLLNPAAGKGEALHLAPGIQAAFQGRDLTLYCTTGPGDAARYVREETLRHSEEEMVFFACGGDGTVREVAEGLRDRKSVV